MSLIMEQIETDCSLSLSEILMRVASIKSQWSDEERQQRAELGDHRRQQLAELLSETNTGQDAPYPKTPDSDSQYAETPYAEMLCLGDDPWFDLT